MKISFNFEDHNSDDAYEYFKSALRYKYKIDFEYGIKSREIIIDPEYVNDQNGIDFLLEFMKDQFNK